MSSGSFSRLTIDTRAIQSNFRLLQKKVTGTCHVSGVIKADSYGLGVDVVVPALEQSGCSFFYVAQLCEALVARSFTDLPIAVLGGLPQGCDRDFIHHRLIPVLNTVDEVKRCPCDLPAIWHIDTGMNRLGLSPNIIPELLKNFSAPLFLMTHFTSSDESHLHPCEEQIRIFDSVAPSSLPHSICNSSGIFRNNVWHRQQVRAGMALYGLNPTPESKNPMHDVVTLEARILQIRHAKAGETAGYNRTHTFSQDTSLAVVGLGYADGFLRSGSNSSVLYWNGQPCRAVGRVSMDLIIVDLGRISGQIPKEGDWLEVIGEHQSADDLAHSWGTIGYEVLTSLGGRSERVILPS